MKPSEQDLGAWVSSLRLRRYVVAPEPTVDLYEWSVRLNGAFFEVICHVEVLIRNAAHEALTDFYDAETWYQDPDRFQLNPKCRSGITDARRRAVDRRHREEIPGRVVAELSFGFWRFLICYHQATVWPRVRTSFGSIALRDMREKMQKAHDFRNRVAHHEPVFQLHDLRGTETCLYELADLVSPAAGEWVRAASRVPEVLAQRPDPV